MILVGQYDSPFVRRVAISLHVLGIPYDRDTRSVFADADAMRRINPLGRIPSLILDDGEVLIDSAAILDHIDQTVGPERALLPATGAARRQALRIIALASGAIEKAISIVYERSLRPPDKLHQPWLDRCAVQLASALEALDQLKPSPWLLGQRLMQPDIMVGAMLGYLDLRAADTVEGRYPALRRFTEQCEREPAFQQTRPAANETMPKGV